MADITACGCDASSAVGSGGAAGGSVGEDGDDEEEAYLGCADEDEFRKRTYQRKYVEAVKKAKCHVSGSPARQARDMCLNSTDGKRKAPPLLSESQAAVWDKAMEKRASIKARVRAAVAKAVKEWRAGRIWFDGQPAAQRTRKGHQQTTCHEEDPEYGGGSGVGRAPNMTANEIDMLVHCLHVPENRREVEMLLDGNKTRAALDDKQETLQPMRMIQATFNDPHFLPKNHFTESDKGGDFVRSVDPSLFHPRRMETLESHFISCRAMVTRQAPPSLCS